MMVRPSPSVARWFSSISLGMLVSVLVQVYTGLYGAGIESILSLTVLFCVLAAVSSGTSLPSNRWRFGLWALPVTLWWLNPILKYVSLLLHSSTGSTTAVPLTGTVLLAVSALPATRIAWTAQRANSGGFNPILFLFGVFAGQLITNSLYASILLAFLLTVCDLVPTPERGWTKLRPSFQFDDLVLTLIAGLWLSSGWVHLRTTFDPTSFGAIAVLVGVALAALIPKKLRARPLSGLALIGGVLWTVLAHMEQLAPRIASWGFNGYGWGLDPILWLSLPLLLLGISTGPYVRCTTLNKAPWIGLAVGLWFGPQVITNTTMIWFSIGVAACSLILAKQYLAQFAGVAVLIFLFVAESMFNAAEFPVSKVGIWGHSNSARSLATWATNPDGLKRGVAALSPSGSLVTWTNGEPSPHLATTLDGLTRSTRGNLAIAEEFAGHLAALIPSNTEGVLILGDDLGNSLRGLAAHPSRFAQVSVPFPISTRFLGREDGVRQKMWISPTNALFGEHPSKLLNRTPPVDTILEVSHRPWSDGAGIRWDQSHIRTVKGRLKPDGTYILCAHLRFWPEHTVAAIGFQLSQAFANVQVWAAPEGVDSLLFVASDTPIPYDNIATRFHDGKIGLESIGFSSPETLAGSALLGTDGIQQWANTASHLSLGNHLNPSVFSKPYLHAGPLAKWMEQYPTPWTTTVPDEVAEVREARRLLLDLYQQATEGRLESAFLSARKLASGHGEVGKEAIAQLVAPHIADARTAIARARPEGPKSKHWDDALRFATTAKMLAPSQAQPHAVLGELALAQGRTDKASTHFMKALEIDATHVPAFDGLAQTARLEKDNTKAEQALRDATRYAPRDWRAWHNMGVFYLETDRSTRALENTETAVGLAPPDEVAPLLVLTKILLQRGESGAALLRAEQCTQMAPENGLSWYLRGRAHYDLNRFNEAEKDFRKAVLTDSNLIEARGGVGLVRAILGDPEAAIVAFKEVLKRDPNNGAARENLRRLQVLVPDSDQP